MDKLIDVLEGDIKLIIDHYIVDNNIEIPDKISEDQLLLVKRVIIEKLGQYGDLQENRETLYKSILGELK